MLIIGLPHDPSPETYDHVLSEVGLRPVDRGLAQPAEFSSYKQRIALVPHTRLSWHRVRLPALPKGQQRAAIEGLLEDQWLQAPASLHISVRPIAEATPDGPNHWVCVCDAQWLRQVLQPLSEAGCMPQRLVPEFAPSDPTPTETLHVLGPSEQPSVVWLRDSGVLAAPWPAPWPLLDATPIQVWAEPAVIEKVQAAFPSESGSEPQALTRAERWATAATSSWDLAQGEWSQTPTQKLWRGLNTQVREVALQAEWRPARWALGLLLVGQALGLLSWAWLTEQEIESQRRALQGMLTQSFPDIQTVVDAPLQMQQALNRLRQQVGAPGHTQAEVMLAHLTQGIGPAPTLTRIRFNQNTLTVQGLKADALSHSHQQGLRELGYSVQDTPEGLRMRWEGRP